MRTAADATIARRTGHVVAGTVAASDPVTRHRAMDASAMAATGTVTVVCDEVMTAASCAHGQCVQGGATVSHRAVPVQCLYDDSQGRRRPHSWLRCAGDVQLPRRGPHRGDAPGRDTLALRRGGRRPPAPTNADLAARARAGAGEGVALVSMEQTAGRGRLDRQWVSPPGTSLSMSLLLTPSRSSRSGAGSRCSPAWQSRRSWASSLRVARRSR